MKKYWPVLALAVGVYFWVSRSSEPIVEESYEDEIEQVQVEEPVTEKPEKVLPAVKVESASEPPISKQAPRTKEATRIPMPTLSKIAEGKVWPDLPSKRAVRFEVVGDYAVAFGDIIVGRVKSNPGNSKYGNYEPKPSQLWESNKIPYAIDNNLTIKSEVLKAIKYFEAKTVIDFVPAKEEDKDKDMLVFTTFEKNCASYLGRTGGQQPIFLSKDCKRDEIVHELMHALGFIHEQSREDRDRYIEVLENNIDPKFSNQYDIMPDFVTAAFRGSVFHFDYDSIMMYVPSAFAIEPGLKTMRSLTNKSIPETKSGLRPIDIERIYYLYGQ